VTAIFPAQRRENPEEKGVNALSIGMWSPQSIFQFPCPGDVKWDNFFSLLWFKNWESTLRYSWLDGG
jgi:hypothetical protein